MAIKGATDLYPLLGRGALTGLGWIGLVKFTERVITKEKIEDGVQGLSRDPDLYSYSCSVPVGVGRKALQDLLGSCI